ncbi:MAG: peptidoglycan-binding domain-containing protein [Patescibacteria group bacterium]|nr:peptidoglycan-binding domain-containing protein [Patescibacteria group bacterium]
MHNSDGKNWDQQETTISPLGVADTQYVTLFVTPHTIAGSSTATYSFFYVRSYSNIEPTVSAPQNEEGSYSSSGNLVSSIFDAASATDFGQASYSYTAATNTTVILKIRTSNNADMSGASDFSSCDSITSGLDISANNCVTDRQRYVQYQVSLTSSDGFYTPKFESFNLNYAPTPTYTLSYSASAGGTISGSLTQIIFYGDDGSSVGAEPNSGYYFSGWNDGNKENSRTDLNIRENLSVVANLIRNQSNSFTPPSTPKISIEPSLSSNSVNWSVANVYQMAISESGDFSKSSWVPYETSCKNSNKILYIKFRSPEGGESKIYTISPEPSVVVNESGLAVAPVVPVINKPEVTVKTAASIKSITTTRQTFKFKNDLKLGMTNTDVKELQKFLNSNGFLVAANGVGSPGQESTYFGGMTRAALAKFQKANNISPALGFFGPITRKLVEEKFSIK